MTDGLDTAQKREQLAAVERELARLRYRHDIAMSAFRFEEATALGPAIAALEQERQALAVAVPPPEPESGTVPVLARPRRRGRSA
jgi:hypothetical protein